jgi:hypothetical protein
MLFVMTALPESQNSAHHNAVQIPVSNMTANSVCLMYVFHI